MTRHAAQGAASHRTGDRINTPGASGELRPDELERIEAARDLLAASGVRMSLRNAVRQYRRGLLDLDGAPVLTKPNRRGESVAVDPEAERLAHHVVGGASR